MPAVTSRVLLALFALQSGAAAVCGLPQPRLICQEYFGEKVVVIAKVARERTVMRDGALVGVYYYMEAVERVKGRILNRFQIYEENASGRATFDWKRGENYLLFITYSKEDRGWELDGCGNSAPMSKAQKALKEIGGIQRGNVRETIEGTIASEESLPEHLAVKIEGGGKTHTVPVENREFKLRVDPGTYTVTPMAPGWTLKKDDFSYDDPAKVRIQAGQCAQIQFQASPDKPK